MVFGVLRAGVGSREGIIARSEACFATAVIKRIGKKEGPGATS